MRDFASTERGNIGSECSRLRRQGKLVSCGAPISVLFSIGEAEKRNSPVSSLSGQAESTKRGGFVEEGARTEYAYARRARVSRTGGAQIRRRDADAPMGEGL